MSNFFVVNGLPGLDGLVVETSPLDEVTNTHEVITLINASAVVGDRTVRYPIPPSALYIDHEYLKPTLDPTKEFTTVNPYGTFLFEGHYKREKLQVAYSVFSNALTVTIFEHTNVGGQKTIYSQNFFASAIDARDAIEECMREDTVDDLVFRLKELKEQESK